MCCWKRRSRSRNKAAVFERAVFVRADALSDVAGDRIVFLGILAAVIVPAMILTATVLRGNTLSVRRVRLLTRALNDQLSYSFAFIFIIVFACLWILIAEMAHWQLSIKLSNHVIRATVHDISWIWNAVAFFLLALVAVRLVKFTAGLRSLLLLNSEIGEQEARARQRREMNPIKDEIEGIQDKADFGRIINPH
jgi:hypothetical protein